MQQYWQKPRASIKLTLASATSMARAIGHTIIDSNRPYTIAFAGTGLIVLSLTWLPYAVARHIASSQFKAVTAATAQISSIAAITGAASGLPNIKFGQLGPDKQYAQSLTDRAKDFHPVRLHPAPPIWPPILPASLFPSRYVARVNQLSTQSTAPERTAAAQLRRAKLVLTHDAQVETALVNVLSYNPGTDFQNFHLHSADTTKRLNLAASGLAKTKSSLEKINRTSDPSLAAVINQIEQLQTARTRLANGGTVDDWIAACQVAQATIIENRLNYWHDQANPIAAQLDATGEQLTTLIAPWTPLARGRF